MAIAAKTVWTSLRSATDSIAMEMGTDPASLPKAQRCVLYGLLAVIAIVVKALIDNGVLTIAQLQAAAAAATQEVWDDQPVNTGT